MLKSTVMEMKWYPVYTKPNLEKKVTSILNRKKIIHFCPLSLISKQKKGIKDNENFSCLVFVKIFENQITLLKEIKGIKNFLYWMHRPAEISEFEINLIKDFLNQHSHIKIEKKEIGFTSTISNNIAQQENGGKLISLNSNRITCSLPSLGYLMIAELENTVVRLSSTENLINYSKHKLKYKLAK